MPWYNKLPDLKNDPRYLAPKIEENAAQLATTAVTIKSSVLYSGALNDMRQIQFILDTILNAVRKNKTIRIAFWGDSITEGFNNYLADTYAERFIAQLKQMFPTIQIEYRNFSLGGRGIWQAVSDSYKAVNPETNINAGFWRSWATVGKTWKQHIVDYNPDLVIVGFGMNDASGTAADSNFFYNINVLTNYLKTNLIDVDIAIVTTILPTENKSVYNQSTEATIQVARAAREYAKNNKLALIDANRLWRILRYGLDEERFTTTELVGLSNVTDKVCYNGEVQLSLSSYPDLANGVDLVIRANETHGILIRFYSRDGGNKFDIYSMDGGFSQAGNLMNSGSAQTTNIVKFEGSKITVNGSTINLYRHLRDGKVYIAQSSQYVSSITLMQRTQLTENPIYTEMDLLGAVNMSNSIGTTGNGINHPTSLGYFLTYYTACEPLLNSIRDGLQVVNSNERDIFLLGSSDFGASPATPPYASTGASGKPIYYYTYPGVKNKKAKMELIDLTNGKVFKRSAITSISQLNQLEDNQFVVFDGDGDTNPANQNLFLTGYNNISQVTSKLIHYVYR